MNMRAFLKGDSKPVNTSTDFDKYSNVTAFAAPKRTYSKANNSAAKSHRKVPDENQCPTDESLAKTRRLEGISEIYQHSNQAGVLDDLHPSNISVTTENKTDKTEGGETGPHSIRKKDHVEKATKDLSFRLDSTESVSDMRHKQAKQEHDVMIVSLIEEIDRLNGLLLEKITENEKLKLINVSLEMRIIDLEGPTRHKSVSKNSIDHSIMDSKVRYGTYETMNSEEDSKVFEEGPSGVQGSTRGAPLQQPRWNSSRKVAPANGAAGKNREKKGALEEKGKIEELLKSVDLLNQSVNEKEKENSMLGEEVEHVRRAYEMVGQKLLQQQQVTEKLRSELMNAHAQNQELNRELLAAKANSGNSASPKVTTISFSRVDGTKTNFSHQEVSEWQKKYEFTKNDNERLIKIVEENHKTIQNFKDIFRELENRHNITFGELRKEYENRIRGMEESRSETKRNQMSGRSENLPTFSGVSSSVNTSHLGRSMNGGFDRGDT